MKSWCFKKVKFMSLVYEHSVLTALHVCMETKSSYREKECIDEYPSHPPAILSTMQQIPKQVFWRFCPMFTWDCSLYSTLGIEERHCRRKIIVGFVCLTLSASKNRWRRGFWILLGLGVFFLEDLVLWCFLHLLVFGYWLSGVCFDFLGEDVKT